MENEVSVMGLPRCVVYERKHEITTRWYEANLVLPSEPSSVVRAIKTLCFPPNRKGEVSDEDFELLRLQGHIGEGRLQVVEDTPLIRAG
jgi:hypothetical protein